MTTERAQLCDLWQDRVNAAKCAHEIAKLRHASALLDYSRMATREAYQDNQQALWAETEALTEYYRVLGIFHKLSVYGIRPPD